MTKASPFMGVCKLGDWSSLRKLERAMRRGLVPSERVRVIEEAIKSAERRKGKYRKTKS
jgi:hypothetical protein